MRIRTIKPEFFLHEELFNAEKETKLPLRLAFAGLWCAADREGRFKWEPRRLGIQILPYDGADFSRVLDALSTRGFIVRYSSGTGVFGFIPSFAKHQVINNRERESELPDPSQSILNEGDDASGTREARVDHAGKAEGKGREQGKEGNKESPSLPFCSLEFAEAWQDWNNHRKEIKKPLKPTQIEKQLEELRAIGEQRAIAMINHTITKGWQGLREPDAEPSLFQDERADEFLAIFAEIYQMFTESAYPDQDGDLPALNRLLHSLPDLTAEAWREGIQWCWKVAANDPYANPCVRQTGSLAAFCCAWSRIVAYNSTYTPPRR